VFKVTLGQTVWPLGGDKGKTSNRYILVTGSGIVTKFNPHVDLLRVYWSPLPRRKPGSRSGVKGQKTKVDLFDLKEFLAYFFLIKLQK